MANIQERRDKNGKLISYSIRVFRGRDADGKQLKPWTATFDVSPGWTEKSARKKAEAFAATFEKGCKEGTATDTRERFDVYCNRVIAMKEKTGKIKHSTANRYKELTTRIYPEIGHIKLKNLSAEDLNDLYTKLQESGNKAAIDKAKSKIDLAAVLKEKKLSRAAIARETGLAPSTVAAAIRGDTVSADTARQIAEAIGLKYEKCFLTVIQSDTISNKTVIEHHRLISSVLDAATKEGLVPYNVAAKATLSLPKAEKRKASYFQPAQVAAIRDALEEEPLKWKTLVHLFLITGARRGEILGLKWAAVDFKGNRIHIENSVLYSADRGIYEDTPKTETSVRWITLPAETMQLLREWKVEQAKHKMKVGEFYIDQGFLFCQDNGQPMHPDTITDWMKKFSARHGLPHIHPHSFRHTMASMLYFNGVDTISISKRLGHAQPSTTANIYAHVIEEADQRSAEILSDIFLKKA